MSYLLCVLKELKSNMLKHGDLGRPSKNKELEAEKQSVTMFVCNAIGSLQYLELNVLNLLNESEMSGFSSLNKITDRLSASIDVSIRQMEYRRIVRWFYGVIFVLFNFL